VILHPIDRQRLELRPILHARRDPDGKLAHGPGPTPRALLLHEPVFRHFEFQGGNIEDLAAVPTRLPLHLPDAVPTIRAGGRSVFDNVIGGRTRLQRRAAMPRLRPRFFATGRT